MTILSIVAPKFSFFFTFVFSGLGSSGLCCGTYPHGRQTEERKEMSQLEELEHPLQKHPLNFTNVQNGNTFYSLTETDSLDFLLDAVPSTLLPPSPDAACSFPSQQRPEPTESPVSSNPSLEEPWEETGTATSASLSMVAFTGVSFSYMHASSRRVTGRVLVRTKT